MSVNQIFVLIIFLLALSIAFLSSLVFVRGLRKKGKTTRALNMSLFLITLSKKIKKNEVEAQKSEKEIISIMEQLYSSLSSIKETKDTFIYGQPHLVFEIVTPQIGEEIIFYMSIPRRYEEIIKKQIHGFYSDAVIEKVDDYNIFNPEGGVAGSYLRMTNSYALPFKTYQNLETDPLNQILSILSRFEKQGEGVVMQVVIRPTLSQKVSKFGLEIAKGIQEGKEYKFARIDAEKGAIRRGAGYFAEALKGQPKKELEENENENENVLPDINIITPLQQETIKAIETKASKVIFETNVRLLVSASDQNRAEQLLGYLESAFVQFDSPGLNGLKPAKMKGRSLKKLIYDFSFRLFNKKYRMFLNTEELTSIFHFPINNQ
ncbi:MAG: hypothetical protein ABIC36_03885 [bacterium]